MQSALHVHDIIYCRKTNANKKGKIFTQCALKRHNEWKMKPSGATF